MNHGVVGASDEVAMVATRGPAADQQASLYCDVKCTALKMLTAILIYGGHVGRGAAMLSRTSSG